MSRGSVEEGEHLESREFSGKSFWTLRQTTGFLTTVPPRGEPTGIEDGDENQGETEPL